MSARQIAIPLPIWAFLTTFLAASSPPHARAEAAQADGRRTVTRTHGSMGTVISVTAYTDDEPRAVAAFDAVFREFDRVDALMTTWTPTSEVSRLNAAAGDGKPVRLSAELVGILARSLETSRGSDGAFDVTVGAFSGVWKFDEDKDGSIPSAALVAERKKLVGWRDLIVDVKHRTARLRQKGQRITLGGIAKGYAVDRGVALLRKAGLRDFILQAGGDMYVSGK